MSDTVTQSSTSKELLAILLGKFKLHIEDAKFSFAEVHELLFSGNAAKTFVAISEIVNVMKEDLLFILSAEDQETLLDAYGNQKMEIDVRLLLEEAESFDT